MTNYRKLTNRPLMRPRHQLYCLRERAVTGDLPVMGVIQAHNLGQDVSVAGVGLRTRGGVPFPVPGRRHRVDREYLISGGEQRLDPGPAVGLDPNLHPSGGFGRLEIRPRGGHVLRDQRMQPADPLQTLRQSCAGQPPPVVVEQFDVVVGSARGAVPAFPLVRFLWPPSRTGRASWPRIRLSTSLLRRYSPQQASAMATEWSNPGAGIG
jgi:hypothetical protein